MGKTLKDLVLALLNATLILVALCLFLGWQLTRTVDGLVDTATDNLQVLTPLRDEIGQMTGEVQGLRADLASLRAGVDDPELLNRLQSQITAIDTRVQAMTTQLQGLAGKPQEMLNAAIEQAGATAAQSVNQIRGCVPPAS